MFDWDQKKSLEIKRRHGFSFEDVILALEKVFDTYKWISSSCSI